MSSIAIDRCSYHGIADDVLGRIGECAPRCLEIANTRSRRILLLGTTRTVVEVYYYNNIIINNVPIILSAVLLHQQNQFRRWSSDRSGFLHNSLQRSSRMKSSNLSPA